ncbi:MAG: hypothetical protein R3242_05195 [Akkermansiaceae bacterium]|nr:hypothetical protein [Akkermansiaceae bacterium]
MKKLNRIVIIWYRCALALCGAFVLFNLWEILESMPSLDPAALAVVLFGMAVFFAFQVNRGCQLAGWMCSSPEIS